ncbi:hypothetical protein lacNasYZ03_09040 [Lactobacillus nasalidis]|uniref:DUF1751 domain-containing protein n=1 Tax=Lactobacillus nasalidis TaxID=2797258 RepID=A0ABQ3W8M2_9LACO|nr:DUF1751 domain-containing protein [Lactobacillus nasalidis]GHV97532.1 hypothetical protein lacNasYZ01_07140 [Lactobacillus nasalidis]GHV99422.1 hypothetical protein lacNasYZ02_08520 [Lactobacillus nasalidis]GHW01217.1 hypothetical protein lacNasYZ03_09040 [Lactobacillus nasalidis]
MFILFTAISVIALLLAIASLVMLVATRRQILADGAAASQLLDKRRRFLSWVNAFELVPNAIYMIISIASFFSADYEPTLLLTATTVVLDLLMGVTVIFGDFFLSENPVSFKQFWSQTKTSSKVYLVFLLLLIIAIAVLNVLIHAWNLD